MGNEQKSRGLVLQLNISYICSLNTAYGIKRKTDSPVLVSSEGFHMGGNGSPSDRFGVRAKQQRQDIRLSCNIQKTKGKGQ